MKKKLCIVIPMFNAEKYIRAAINSILSSNLPHDMYDILVVNDGSTDNGPQIVYDIAKSNEKVKMFSQANGGLSSARNTGIEQSDAEYIWFFDADDCAENDLNIIVDLLNSDNKADVYVFEYNWLNESMNFVGNGCHHPAVTHNCIIKGRDAIIQGYTPGSVCGMLINKAFLVGNNLRFAEGITHEDVVFSSEMMSIVSKVHFSYNKIYNYILRQNTMSRALDLARKKKYLLDDVEVIKHFYTLASKFKDTDKTLYLTINKYADGCLFGCVYEMYRNRRIWKSQGINNVILSKLKAEGFYPLKVSTGSLKRRIASVFLNFESLIS